MHWLFPRLSLLSTVALSKAVGTIWVAESLLWCLSQSDHTDQQLLHAEIKWLVKSFHPLGLGWPWTMEGRDRDTPSLHPEVGQGDLHESQVWQMREQNRKLASRPKYVWKFGIWWRWHLKPLGERCMAFWKNLNLNLYLVPFIGINSEWIKWSKWTMELHVN